MPRKLKDYPEKLSEKHQDVHNEAWMKLDENDKNGL